MFPELKAVRDSLEQNYFKQQAEVEQKACALYASDKPAALKQLNDYSNQQAQHMLKRWTQLAFHLIVKYNDMAIKPTDAQGQFVRTKTGIGATVSRPGFPKAYARKLVKELTPEP